MRFMFASEWDYIRVVIGKAGWGGQRCDFPTKSLEEAFIKISDLSSAEFKICFFVDGLDEYDGGPELLINLFTTISKSPYVKVCLSSRLWLIFEKAFESCPGFRSQDLTRDDIVQYVLEKLQTNKRIKRLK
jgi:hypothetical protein